MNPEEEKVHLMEENDSHIKQEVIIKIPTSLVGSNNLNNYHQLDQEDETEFFCTKCRAIRTSTISYSYGPWVYIFCCLLCFACIIGGPLPFFIRKCHDRTHYCETCGNMAGKREFQPSNCCS